MPESPIERRLRNAGKPAPAQLHAISVRSNGVLARRISERAQRGATVPAAGSGKENGPMIRKLGLLAAMLIALGTAGLGTNAASATDSQVLFRASYAGAAAFTGETSVAFSGTGVARVLGHGTNVGNAQFTDQVPNADCFGGVEFPNVHTETLTAADGDSLTITAHDIACPTSEYRFRGTGFWEVTGGTGRFGGATGEGTLEGQADFTQGWDQGEFSFRLTGTISAPRGG